MSGKWLKEKVNQLKINQLTSQKVRVKGLEPIRARHQILSLACLPISTHPRKKPPGQAEVLMMQILLLVKETEALNVDCLLVCSTLDH